MQLFRAVAFSNSKIRVFPLEIPNSRRFFIPGNREFPFLKKILIPGTRIPVLDCFSFLGDREIGTYTPLGKVSLIII